MMELLIPVLIVALVVAAIVWPTDETAGRFDRRTLERLQRQVDATRTRDRGWVAPEGDAGARLVARLEDRP